MNIFAQFPIIHKPRDYQTSARVFHSHTQWVLCAMVLDICGRASTILDWTDDDLAILPTTVAVIGGVIGVEQRVKRRRCGRDQWTSTSAHTGQLKLRSPRVLPSGTAPVLPEKECHGGNKGEERIDRDLHLGV